MAKKSRNTRQKEVLQKELAKFSSFFTAEELLKKAKKIDGNIGIATVYRFLKENRDKKHVHSYTCDRKTIYSTKDESHSHFICEKCGKIEHIKINSIDFIKSKINGKICHFQIDVTGLCENCLSKA